MVRASERPSRTDRMMRDNASSTSSTRSDSRCPASSPADRPSRAVAPWLTPSIRSVTGSRTKTASATASRICRKRSAAWNARAFSIAAPREWRDRRRTRGAAARTSAALRGGERDGPEDLPRDGHRRAHPRRSRRRRISSTWSSSRAARDDHGVVDLGEHHRLPESRDGIGTDRRVGIGADTGGAAPRRSAPLGVAVGDREASACRRPSSRSMRTSPRWPGRSGRRSGAASRSCRATSRGSGRIGQVRATRRRLRPPHRAGRARVGVETTAAGRRRRASGEWG